jgi:hypothetical protein
MTRRYQWPLPFVGATVWMLVCSVAPTAFAQQAKRSPPPSGGVLSLPGSPLDMLLAIPGLDPPLQYQTSVAHTSSEIANPNRPVGPEYLWEGLALGNEGVVQAGRFPLPFGTKGCGFAAVMIVFDRPFTVQATPPQVKRHT